MYVSDAGSKLSTGGRGWNERVQRDRDGERGVGRECGEVSGGGGGGYRVEGGVCVVDGGAERRADAGWGPGVQRGDGGGREGMDPKGGRGTTGEGKKSESNEFLGGRRKTVFSRESTFKLCKNSHAHARARAHTHTHMRLLAHKQVHTLHTAGLLHTHIGPT